MEFRKTVLTNLSSRQQWRCRHGEWANGYSGGRRGWEELREEHWNICITMDREAWSAAIHGVAKSRTRLSDWTELNWTLLGWCKNNFNFALLNFVIWYWNAFLNKRGIKKKKQRSGLKQSTFVISHSFEGQEQPSWVTGSGSLLLLQSSCASLDDYPKAWLGLEHPFPGSSLTDLASWCWLLAGGLSSFPTWTSL